MKDSNLSTEKQGSSGQSLNLASKFLHAMHPDRPWAVMKIWYDKEAKLKYGNTRFRTFHHGSEPLQKSSKLHSVNQIDNWLTNRDDEGWNKYWLVNEAMAPCINDHGTEKKPKKIDIKRVWRFHVDLDAPTGKDVDDFVDRVLVEISELGVPWPTTAVMSGGGVQLFWDLIDPIEINGDEGLALDAERYNRGLENQFAHLGADDCHNIDRVMRLPGYSNVPDQKKIDKGRVERQAHVLWHYPDQKYSKDQFAKGPKANGRTFGSVETRAAGTAWTYEDVAAAGPINAADLEHLKAEHGLSDSCVIAINRGEDPDNPKEGDNSRSAWVFHVTCEMVRKGVSNEDIFSILTDNGWGIAASVLESKDPGRYANRQIERAHQQVFPGKGAPGDELHRYALISGDFFDIKQGHKMGKDAMIRATAHWIMPGGKDTPDLRKASDREMWLVGKLRRGDRMDFVPAGPETWTEEDGTVVVNTWFALPDLRSNGEEPTLYLEHLSNIYPAHKEVILDFLAAVVQGKKIGWALFFQGSEQCGKDTIVWPIVKYLGKYANKSASPATLVNETHNAGVWYRKQLVLFQESRSAKYGGKQDIQEVLKPAISMNPDTLPIRMMGKDYFDVQNVVNAIFLSNFKDSVLITHGSQRYYPCFTNFTGHIGIKPKKEYFDELYGWMKDRDGWREVIQMLMDRDVGHLPKNAPDSPDKFVSVTANLHQHAALVEDFVDGKRWVSRDQVKEFLKRTEDADIGDRPLEEVLEVLGFKRLGDGVGKDYFKVRVPDGMNDGGTRQVRRYVYCREGCEDVRLEQDFRDQLKNTSGHKAGRDWRSIKENEIAALAKHQAMEHQPEFGALN